MISAHAVCFSNTDLAASWVFMSPNSTFVCNSLIKHIVTIIEVSISAKRSDRVSGEIRRGEQRQNITWRLNNHFIPFHFNLVCDVSIVGCVETRA